MTGLPVGRVIVTDGYVADTGLESSDGSESGSSSAASTGSSDSDGDVHVAGVARGGGAAACGTW